MAFEATDKSLTPTAVFRASEPAELQALLTAALAAAPQDERVIDAQIAGAGAGHTFELVLTSTTDPNEVGVAPLASTVLVRCARDGLRSGLATQLAALIAALPAGASVLKVAIAGAGNGATYMGVVFASTDPSSSLACVCNDCPPLTRNLWVDGETPTPLPDQTGGECTPFETIQQANDVIAAGDPETCWTVHVNQGIYTENLTLPPDRVITYNAIGGLVAQVGNVTYADPGAHDFALYVNGQFQLGLTGLFTATAVGPDAGFLLQFHGDFPNTAGLFAFDGTGFVGTIALRFTLAYCGDVNAPTANLAGFNSFLLGTIIANLVQWVSGLCDSPAITVTSPSQFWATIFETATPVFTGPVGGFIGDETAISTFLQQGGTLAGGATFVYLDDDLGKAVTAFAAGNFSDPQPIELHETLQRIATRAARAIATSDQFVAATNLISAIPFGFGLAPVTRPGPITALFFVAHVVAGVGESLTVDVTRNGVSILPAPFVYDATKPANTKIAIPFNPTTLAIGDLMVFPRTYVAGVPTPIGQNAVEIQWQEAIP